MHDLFTYATDDTTAAVTGAGGVVVGRWRGAGGIGWWDDEVVTLAGWPEGTSPPAAAGEPYRATARPTDIHAIDDKTGVYAHRLFDIDGHDWDEFLQLSTEAWPAFESEYGATIHGFFRSEAQSRVLLITHYPSMAAWEQSRGVGRSSNADAAEAGKRFLRRREITKRSIVRTGYLL